MFEQFDSFAVEFDGTAIAGKISKGTTAKPALLLLHGHPQTHVMWHKVADLLVDAFTVVAVDLPGYGQSKQSQPGDSHVGGSKREMARILAGVMGHLGRRRGFTDFAVCAHDRGARVAHRLCVDHPHLVTRAMFLDIAPTLDMYENTTREFATAYWHWFFLIQKSPLPETLIMAGPMGYLRGVMGTRHAGLAPFTEPALEAYAAALSRPSVAHGITEDYRASATIDLEHDRADREAGVTLDIPLRVLWGRHGVIEQLFDALALWSAVATDVTGEAVDCGHYIAEEHPDQLLTEIHQFFGATADHGIRSGTQ